jgi:hypothetical protein
MVTPKGDNPWVVFAVKRDRIQRLACYRVVTQRREGRALKEGLVAVFYLFDGILIVIGGDRNVS